MTVVVDESEILWPDTDFGSCARIEAREEWGSSRDPPRDMSFKNQGVPNLKMAEHYVENQKLALN